MSSLKLHLFSISHPCRTAIAALELKGLDFERVEMVPGSAAAEMERIFGEGRSTVPGMLIDGEKVHGSRAILAALERLAPEPSLYPVAIADEVREAERWGDEELQDLGRRLPWGAMHFRPDAMGSFGGADTSAPAAVDFAIAYTRSAWKYHGISAERLAGDLAGLPAKLDHIDALADTGIIGGEQPTAADLQMGATLRVLLNVGDVRPMLDGRAGERIARRWFADYPGEVPAGAFPSAWLNV